MALDIWSEFKEQVRSQTNIVELVAETRTVTPRKGGREYVTLCPFHDDHTPSMTIDPERQSYRCWVCDAGGDCFSYLMNLEKLDFRQSLEQLAERAGLEMPKAKPIQVGTQKINRNDLLAVMEWAAREFHRCLLDHPEAAVARDYLYDRGFCEEIWVDFQLGFHPGPWEWLMSKAAGKYSLELLEAARLISPKATGTGYLEHFRGRITFPIHNERSQVIAFGGRVLPGSEEEKFGKYQNSKEGALFSKSRQLYGIEHAREAMKESDQVLVVEGYTDCIALHQQGLSNVVATLGTALTAQHVQLIRRFCKQVVLVFDGDQAGQNAAQRALPVLLSQDIDLKLLALPENLDPPEYLQRYGLQNFQNFLQTATDAWEFKLQSLTAEHGTETSHGRDKIVEQMIELLALATDLSQTPRENYLLNRLANRVGLKGGQEAVLHQQLKKKRASGPRLATVPSITSSNQASSSGKADTDANDGLNYTEAVNQLLREPGNRRGILERDLLETILMMPECITLVAERGVLATLENQIVKKILWECDRISQRTETVGADRLLVTFDDPELKRLILGLIQTGEDRRIDEKLQEQVMTTTGQSWPAYLIQLLDQLDWEHRESQHRKSSQSYVAHPAQPITDDDRLQQMLQDAARFHQQRVTRKSAST